MSYIEKERLIRADIASIENKVRHAFNQGYDLGYKDGKKKAKVLDKIRAEIIDLRSKQNVGVLECLDIIDKYRAESEGKKCSQE